MLSRRRALERQLYVGIAIVVAVAIAVTLGVLKPNPLDHPQRVAVIFDDATGISIIQRDVRVAGVKVGRIGSVRRRGDDAEVQLLLDQPVGTIHADARASLRPHTPFEGTAFVDLDPGSASAPPLGDRPIPKAQTTVYVSLDEGLRVLNTPARKDLTAIVPELHRAFDPPGSAAVRQLLQAAPPLLASTAQAARAVRGSRGDELRTLLPGLAQTSDALAGHNRQLRRAVDDTASTLDAVATDGAAPVDATLASLPSVLRQVRRTGAQADRLVATTATFADTLRPALTELAPTARAATPVLRAIRPTLRRAGPLLRQTRTVLRTAVSATPALRQLLTTAQSIGVRLNTSLLPAATKDSRYGLPAYLQLLSAFTGLTGILSPYQTDAQSALGAGHALRGTIDLSAPIASPLPKDLSPLKCAAVAQLNPQFQPIADQLGLCTP